MAEGITAKIKDIKNGVALLTTEAKKAASEVAQISTKLKFDPTNVSLLQDKFTALSNELEANNKKAEGLRNALEELKATRAGLKGDTAAEKEQIAEIAKLTSEYENALKRSEQNIARINQLLSNTNKSSQIVSTVTAQINDKYAVWLQFTEKLATATKKLYNTLKQTVTESAELGLSLSTTAKRYNASVEDIQVWDRTLQLATGQSELFTQSLSVMVKGMSQIAAGRGVAFRKALSNIGLAYQQIRDLSAGEQFEKIVEGLANVENYSQRAAAAQQLFGESGQYIASALSNGIESLNGYKEQAAEFGIVTKTDAEALAQMQIQIEKANAQLAQVKAQLAVALQPALEVITDIIRTFLIPAIKNLSEGFKLLSKGGQAAVLVLGVSIAILPRFIRLLATTRIALMSVQQGAGGATVAVTGLNAALGVIGIVLMAISALITLITALVSKAEDQTKSATGALREFTEVAESAGLIGEKAQINTESTATSLTTKDINIAVEIHGYGDTEVSDTAAEKVAMLTADEVQKAWGELTK